MRVVIIEDEPLTATDLADTIRRISEKTEIVEILSSVKESIAYFRNHPDPDLIFSDVTLGDGLCFEIFNQVNVDAPVIFCTAYDSYMLDAFKSNGIDYILKPFSSLHVEEALKKYERLSRQLRYPDTRLSDIYESIKKQNSQNSFLISYKDRIIPVPAEEVAIFYIKSGITYLHHFEGQAYQIGKNLEELEEITGSSFYRVNRQYIINKKAIRDTSRLLSRKLKLNLTINFPEDISVSKEKASSFLKWFAS